MSWEAAQQRAIKNVIDAFTDAGPHPSIHRAQMRHLRDHWPVMYYALVRLSAAHSAGLLLGSEHGNSGVPRHDERLSERQREFDSIARLLDAS